MVKTTESLRDYVQAIEFEAATRGFLLKWARQKGLEDTEEYRAWAEEAAEWGVAAQAARAELKELYPDGYTFPPPPAGESFSSMLHRYFPSESQGAMHTGGNHVKDITIQVTEDCNMACTYCYQQHKTARRMNFETASRFIDYILGEGPSGPDPYVNPEESAGVVLAFIGGEPFLEIELIEKIADYFLERTFLLHHRWATRFMFCFTSNGLLYFDRRVQSFLTKYSIHVSLSISIDGNKELHDACRLDKAGNGTYDRALAASLHYAKRRPGGAATKLTIAPGNVSYLYEAIRSLTENGYTDIHANCVFEEGWTLDHARTFYRQLLQVADYIAELDKKPRISLFDKLVGRRLPPEENKNWCGGTGLMLAVDWRGDLYPCLRYMETSLGGQQEPYKIGDIEHGVCDAGRVNCLDCITRRSQSTDECFNCPIAGGCAWCSAYNYQINGTPDKRVTYICVMHKARVLANEYYWHLLGEEYAVEVPPEWREAITGGSD